MMSTVCLFTLEDRRVRIDRLVTADIRYDELEHYPATNDTQMRCAQCRGEAKFNCVKCAVGLHTDCFAS